jgi:hypothetical protein
MFIAPLFRAEGDGVEKSRPALFPKCHFLASAGRINDSETK